MQRAGCGAGHVRLGPGPEFVEDAEQAGREMHDGGEVPERQRLAGEASDRAPRAQRRDEAGVTPCRVVRVDAGEAQPQAAALGCDRRRLDLERPRGLIEEPVDGRRELRVGRRPRRIVVLARRRAPLSPRGDDGLLAAVLLGALGDEHALLEQAPGDREVTL